MKRVVDLIVDQAQERVRDLTHEFISKTDELSRTQARLEEAEHALANVRRAQALMEAELAGMREAFHTHSPECGHAIELAQQADEAGIPVGGLLDGLLDDEDREALRGFLDPERVRALWMSALGMGSGNPTAEEEINLVTLPELTAEQSKTMRYLAGMSPEGREQMQEWIEMEGHGVPSTWSDEVCREIRKEAGADA